MARHVLYGPAPKRSTNGIWRVPFSSLLFYSYRQNLISFHISVLGKAEGSPNDFHGHVTALTVAPEYRRLSLARILMNFLETVSDDVYGGLFVDLFVRCTNSIAIDLYEGLGYSVFRRVREYYGSIGLGPNGKDEEDAFGPFSLFFSFPEKKNSDATPHTRASIHL
jgi:ribosomal protein S18 acetylase RimI-like enzyme